MTTDVVVVPAADTVGGRANVLVVKGMKVNRSRAPQLSLESTRHRFWCKKASLRGLPDCRGNPVDVHFFRLEEAAFDPFGFISSEALAEHYEQYGLKPDPLATAAVHEADHTFSTKRPNGVVWRGDGGRWYKLTFRRVGVAPRSVLISEDFGWHREWWFSGVPT